MGTIDTKIDTISKSNIIPFPIQEKFDFFKEEPNDWLFVRTIRGINEVEKTENITKGKLKILHFNFNKRD